MYIVVEDDAEFGLPYAVKRSPECCRPVHWAKTDSFDGEV